MADVTRHIRNLSIALEAVSKIAPYDGAAERLWVLLRVELEKAEKKKGQRTARPAEFAPDDEIPF